MGHLKSILFIGIISLIPALAFAIAGQYTVTFYSEIGSGSGTQGICILGSGNRGTWYSDTYPDWSGQWFIHGNELHLNGNYVGGFGNDGFDLTRINHTLATGYWQEWRDDRSYVDYLTTRFDYKKTICNPRATFSKQRTANTENPSKGR